MRDFNSLPPFQFDDSDLTGERHSDGIPVIPPVTIPPDGAFTGPHPAQPPFMAIDPGMTKKRPAPISGPVHDVPTTQSLIAALQSTMAPSQAVARRPVVIPGARKRMQNTEDLHPVRRMSARLRYAIVLAVIILVLLLTLLSLAPLGGGQSPFHLLGGVVNWVQTEQQNWNLIGQIQSLNQRQNQAGAPAAPAGPPPPVTLPKSQYVALAQQDAIAAGINPDYFVRQINAESGFNPYAVSPYGAVGIAQFLPSTAAGLGINPWDPVSALQGAARYMANYVNQYGGDYAKALAAYNAGSGTVNYAVNAGGANWMNYLPAETRNYIHTIMGI